MNTSARAEWKAAWRVARIRAHWVRCRNCGYSLEEYQQQFGDRIDVICGGRCTALDMKAIILHQASGDPLAWKIAQWEEIPF